MSQATTTYTYAHCSSYNTYIRLSKECANQRRAKYTPMYYKQLQGRLKEVECLLNAELAELQGRL